MIGGHEIVSPPAQGWRAELELNCAAAAGRTFLRQRSHRGPLVVQRAFYPEGPECCHLYVLHPPAGVVGGDELDLRVTADAGAHVLLTTPAAGKLYRSAQRWSRQSTRLGVGEGARLEWLPSEVLAFEGAHATLELTVELHPGGRFLGWDVLCLGRPSAGERFRRGVVVQRTQLSRAGEPVFIERTRYEGGSPVLDAPWGLGGHPVSGWLMATPATEHALEVVRALVPPPTSLLLASVSLLGDVLVCRVLSGGTAAARAWLERVWSALRPEVLGRAPSPPRIWKT